MSVFTFFKKLVKSTFLSGLEHAVHETMNEAETRAEEIIDHAEVKATKFMHNLIKGSIMFFLALTGVVFALVGLGTYLSQTVEGLDQGIGYIIIGGILLVLVVFARLMQRE